MAISISEIVRAVADALSIVLRFLRGDDKATPIINTTIEILISVAAILDRFNNPLTSKEKREGVRFIAKFLKYAPTDLLHKLADMKEQAKFSELTPAELDAAVGLAISAYVSGKSAKQAETFPGPKRST